MIHIYIPVSGVELAAVLESVEPSNVNNAYYSKSDLYIKEEWNAESWEALNAKITSDLTSVAFSDETVVGDADIFVAKNPNSLKYFSAEAGVPESWTTNVIKGNAAATNIVLVDGYKFYNTRAFTATNASYECEYTGTGWASLYLPFSLSTFPDGISVKEFDDVDGTKISFVDTQSITANKPYIVNVTGDLSKSYAVTGSTTDFPVTAPIEVLHGDYTFKGTFSEIPQGEATGLYLLMDTGEGFGEGTELASVPAFRTYIESSSSGQGAKMLTIEIDGGATGMETSNVGKDIRWWSADGVLMIEADSNQIIQLYSIDGKLVSNLDVKVGVNTFEHLDMGVYLMKNQKVVIK